MPEIIAPMNEVLSPQCLPSPTISHTILPYFKPHSPRIAFLSYLRLSVYMAVVSIAIVISFHLKQQPTPLERRMSQPLGIIFGLLSLACLCLGFGNYMKTVNKYGRRVAIVQAGWKTQSVCYVPYFCLGASCYKGKRSDSIYERNMYIGNVPALRAVRYWRPNWHPAK